MRHARILSVSLDQPDEARDRASTNLECVLEALDEAARYDPDFVCFPEWTLAHRADSPYELAQPIPGRTIETVAERARTLDSNVLLPLIEEDGDAYRNTTACIDRAGELAGTYRKIRPTVVELDAGVEPGTEPILWDTDHGPVSTVTCFDVNFPDVGLALSRRKPRVVFFLSLFAGGDLLSSWALEYGFHVVKCTPTSNAVITPTGNAFAENDDRNAGLRTDLDAGGTARFGFYDLNTDFGQYHIDFHVDAFDAIRREYGGEVVFHKASDEAVVVIESISEDVTVEDLEREFDLEDRRDYLDRSLDACDNPL